MISINAISSPQYSTLSNTYIDVTLNTLEYGFIPCTLGVDDPTVYNILDANTHGYDTITMGQLFLNAANGAYGNVAPFVIDLPNAKQNAYSQISQVCDYISAQVIPSQTKQLAYQNAAMILGINGGNPPANGINATLFNSLALTWGMNANTFANLIMAMQQTSIELAALELGTQNQVNASQSANQLLIVINTFESTIANTINSLNAVLPVPVSNPPSIVVQGINS